jgi:hypothetical protein
MITRMPHKTPGRSQEVPQLCSNFRDMSDAAQETEGLLEEELHGTPKRSNSGFVRSLPNNNI